MIFQIRNCELLRLCDEAIDAVFLFLSERFDQVDSWPMLKIHDIFINSANEIFSSNLTEELKQFGGIVNLEALRELPVYVEIYNMENSAKLKKITLISTM